MKKCLVIGAAYLDVIMQIDKLPKTGDEVYAQSQQMQLGGCAYNVADIIRHFDLPYTLFAPIGSGIYAEIIKKKLALAEHDSPISSDKQDNGYSLCLIENTGERTFLSLPGIECSFEQEWFETLDSDEYSSVYVCGYEIEGAGGDTIIDFLEKNPTLEIYYAPGPRICHISEEKHSRLMALKPIIHLNEKEALEYTGCTDYIGAAKSLYDKYNNMVIITLGSKGAYYFDGIEGKFSQPEQAQVVDTIGAGDSHIAAVIAMRLLSFGWDKSIASANKVSAKVVGVQGSTISKEDFNRQEIIDE